MELGEKLRQARLEAGLSQRQLCGEEITRNMLSQIENGSARPSMATLQYLAARLGKPAAWFLEEDASVSPNGRVMDEARKAYAHGQFREALSRLEQYQAPDPVFDPERQLLQALVLLALAEQAAGEGKKPYALSLLEQVRELLAGSIYCNVEPERRRRLLMFRLRPDQAGQLEEGLPDPDEELLLRSRAALDAGHPQRAGSLLDGARDHSSHQWLLARGEVFFAMGDYTRAVEHYTRVEDLLPQQALPRLEACWRELEDYKKAYHYACLQRDMKQAER